MKRFAALILVMACALSFAGCSEGANPAESSAITAPVETAEANVTEDISEPAESKTRVFTYNGEEITVGYAGVETQFLNGISGEYTLYDSSKLKNEILENRNGTRIIERVIGIVTDAEAGDGEILNPAYADHNYIGYHTLSEAGEVSNGSIVVSYMEYSTETNYIDDITERWDFVLS